MVYIIISTWVCRRPTWKPKQTRNGQHSVAVWVRFVLLLDSLDPPNAENRVRCVGVAICVRLYSRENINQMTCTPRTQSISADHGPGFFFRENQTNPLFPILRYFLFKETFFFTEGKKHGKKNSQPTPRIDLIHHADSVCTKSINTPYPINFTKNTMKPLFVF